MKKIFFLILLMAPLCVRGFSTSCSSGILMDLNSGRIMYSKNINDVKSVASISKIMTAIVVIENVDIKKEVTVGDEIDKAYGSGIYVKKGEVLTMEDLLYGLMLRSGNDASYVLAKNTFGTEKEFIEKMNEYANKLDMQNSTFNNPNGLDNKDGNYSTALDMSKLVKYAYQNDIFRDIVSTKKYKLKTNMNTYIWYNKHRLVNDYKYATGGKTGYTLKARRTLVTTASNNNLDLVVVTLNDGNDFADHKNLFEYGFNNFKNYKLLSNGTLNINSIYENLYLKRDFYYPLTRDEEGNIKIEYELKRKTDIVDDEVIGKANVYISGELIHSESIYVKNEKKFFEKLKDWFINLW